MFTLNTENAPTLLLPNDTSTGWKLITIATLEQRHYRITKENTATGFLGNMDFYLTLSDYPQGSKVELDIPYKSSLFKDIKYLNSDPSVPVELNRAPTASIETFQGETYKLLYITAQDINGETFSAEVPSLIDFKTTYTIGSTNKQVRFIYFRVIGGVARYTGYLGNIAFNNQYTTQIQVDINKVASVVTKDGIDYYIIRITPTPNVIITNGIPKNKEISDSYSGKLYDYTMIARGGGQIGIPFKVQLTAINRETKVSFPFSSNTIYYFDQDPNADGIQLRKVEIADPPTSSTLTLLCTSNPGEFRIYLSFSSTDIDLPVS